MAKLKGIVLGILGFLLVAPAVIFALWAWASMKFTYSSGERSGYIQKFSKKGWLCKTWEGEIAMVSMPGTAPQMFAFTVRDPQIAQTIEKSIGQRISISYDQHRFVPTNCFGETEYFVTKIQVLPDMYSGMVLAPTQTAISEPTQK